ncbi:MAG: lipopolysaccharide assembly protein LapA domain-containing protein [Gallionella sp.]
MSRTSRQARNSGNGSANRRPDFRHSTSTGGISQGIAAFFYAIVAVNLTGYAMRYLNWIIRVLLFIALLGFAAKNDQPITLKYFFGYEWQSYLVVALLIFFTAGAVVGVFAMFPKMVQQRREIAALKRQLRAREKLAESDETQQLPG